MSFKIRSSGFISLRFAGIGCNGPLQIKNFPLPALRESDSIDGCKYGMCCQLGIHARHAGASSWKLSGEPSTLSSYHT
jgi:hypothetical protein